MRRRPFLLVGLALAAAAARAQVAGRPHRIAWLITAEPGTAFESVLEAFRRHLRSLGHADASFAIELHSARGKVEDLPSVAARLVASRPDVIVASTTPAVKAAAQATREIPIVMANVSDPVGSGLVKSLARPGGNVTGAAHISAEISPKLLELARALVDKPGRVAVLMASDNPAVASAFDRLKAAGRDARIDVVAIRIASVEEMRTAFARAHEARANAAIVLSDSFMIFHREELAALAAKSRLPVVYQFREHVEVGGLVSLGADLRRHAAVVAEYVDRILRGAKPSDLPVREPIAVSLVVNLKAARAQGLKIPQDVLSRADELIE